MKTILVLTNFSGNALRAAETAVILAGKIHANLLIVHSDDSIPIIPFYEDAPVVTETVSWKAALKEQLDKLVTHLQRFADLHVEQRRKLNIQGKLMTGDLSLNVQEILKGRIVELIVIGARSGSKLDHILFGSDTNSLIEHAGRPVLVIPPNYTFGKLDRIIFATNFNETEIYAINHLYHLGKQLQYQLEILHVNLYGDKPGLKNESMRGYINELSKKKYPAVLFREVKGKRLLPRLIKQCKEREADILAISHQHHSYLMRLLKEGTVTMSLGQQKIPILVFPPNELQTIQKKGKPSVSYIF